MAAAEPEHEAEPETARYNPPTRRRADNDDKGRTSIGTWGKRHLESECVVAGMYMMLSLYVLNCCAPPTVNSYAWGF